MIKTKAFSFKQASSIFPCPAKLVNIAVRTVIMWQAAGMGYISRKYISENLQSILTMLTRAESLPDLG